MKLYSHGQFGYIPDPPERCEGCGNCRYNYREKQDTFSCSNEESGHYGEYTDYDDYCDSYEAKEDYE